MIRHIYYHHHRRLFLIYYTPTDLHPPTHTIILLHPLNTQLTHIHIDTPSPSCLSSAALASDEGPSPGNCAFERFHFLAARFLQLPTDHFLQTHHHPPSARIRLVWQPAPALPPASMDSPFTQLYLPSGCMTGHLSCLIGNTLSRRQHSTIAKMPRAAISKPLRETLMERMRTRHSSPWSYLMQAL